MATGKGTLSGLGALAKARREGLRLTQDEVYAATGLSPTTQIRVESGKRVRGLSYTSYESGVYWTSGSCRRYLETGEPPTELTPPQRILDRSQGATGAREGRPASPEEHIALLHSWADNDPGLTDDQRREFQTLIRLAEERIAKRRRGRRMQA